MADDTVNEEILDRQDTLLAHSYRLSLPSKPTQSSFRVLAVLFYETETQNKTPDSVEKGKSILAPWISQTSSDGRTYIVGTNDEPGFMGGAVCAERSAMVQLRFVPNFRITKLVIATDSVDPITPGVLCREFFAGHASVPWDLRVVTSGCSCAACGKKDEEIFDTKNCVCSATGGDSTHREHVLQEIHTTLSELYPFPSPYIRLTSGESVDLGERYSGRAITDLESLENADSKRLLELAIMEARANVTDLHPIQFGAAVIFDDGTITTSHQSAALEYGCTLDAVSQLAPYLQEGPTPLLLVQADQYGIAHAPFAPARAFLTENGYGDCQIVVHDVAPSKTDGDFTNMESWVLREVFVTDLQPHAPSWTEGTDRGESNGLSSSEQSLENEKESGDKKMEDIVDTRAS